MPQSGGYVWYEVADVKPARDRPLDEVKDQLETRWRNDQIAARLRRRRAMKWLKSSRPERHSRKSPVPLISSRNGGPASSAAQPACPAFRRAPSSEIFRTPKDAAAASDGAITDRPHRVPRHRDQRAAARSRSRPTSSASTKRLRRALSEDLLGQYVARLETDIGVTINQAALNQVTGASPGN